MSPRRVIERKPAARHRAMLSSNLAAALVRRAVAGAIDQPQDFAGIRQTDHQRVVSPLAFPGNVHSLFALAIGFDLCAIAVENACSENRSG